MKTHPYYTDKKVLKVLKHPPGTHGIELRCFEDLNGLGHGRWIGIKLPDQPFIDFNKRIDILLSRVIKGVFI